VMTSTNAPCNLSPQHGRAWPGWNKGKKMRYPTRFEYHPELDVLRFVAFLAVFMHHALPRDAGLYIRNGLSPYDTQWLLTAKEAGAFGLDLFFALSAYLITEL